MRLALAILLCGCNQAFDLGPAVLIDAPPPIEPPPPPVCPIAGSGELPTFSGELRQLPLKTCQTYTPSAIGALAVCNDELSFGPVDAELLTVTMNPAPPYNSYSPRISPDGDRLIMLHSEVVSQTTRYYVDEYETANGMTWSHVATRQLPSVATAISAPIRGTNGRFLVQQSDPMSTFALVELVPEGSTLREVKRTRFDVLGVPTSTTVYRPSMSADGLRLVFTLFVQDYDGGYGGRWGGSNSTSEYVLHYADRASLDVPFGAAKPIATMPSGVMWPYLTEDCGRIYFSALGTVFYIKQ